MKISFLGTGAAEGVPAMFCNCRACREIRALGESQFRTRSQIIIDGVLGIDFPPEAYAHSLKFGVNLSSLKYLLITHSHMDHCYAHDFILRGYKYAELDEDVLQVYGNSEVEKVISECTAREMKEEVRPHISFTRTEPFSEFCAGEYRVLTLPANHSRAEDALLFYVERQGKGYLHLYDTGRTDGKIYDYLKDMGARADLVAFDCTFAERTGGSSARHMGIEDDLFVKDALMSRGIIDGRSRLVLTHFSHNANPTRERMQTLAQANGFTAAYDGFTAEI